MKIMFFALSLALVALVAFSAYGQDVTIDCKSGRTTAQIQENGSIKITCAAPNTPPPPPTKPPVDPPKPPDTPPPTGKTWTATPETLQALIGPDSKVQAGDTVQLGAGTYIPGSWGPYNAFRAMVSGKANAPVTIKGQAGAKLDCKNAAYGCLYLEGDYLILQGVEIANSDTDRTKPRGNGIEVRGNFLTITDCYIHDTSTGVFASESAKWLKITGNRVINNGYKDSTGDHGNGLYVQNDGLSVKEIRANIVGNSYGNGIQLFGRNAETKGYIVEDNIVFGSGSPVNAPNRNLIVGGSKKGADGLVVRNNFFFHDPGYVAANVSLGYEKGNGSVIFDSNIAIGGTGVYVVDWDTVEFTDNVVIGRDRLLTFDSPDWGGVWKSNQYFSNSDRPFASQGGLPVQAWTWPQWKANTDEQGSAFSAFGEKLPAQWVIFDYGMAIWSPNAEFDLSPWLAGRQAVDAVSGEAVSKCKGFCAVVFR